MEISKIDLLRLILLSVGIIGIDSTAHAYTGNVRDNGSPIRWKAPFTFNLVGNPSGAQGVSTSDFFGLVANGLQQWKSAGRGSFDFDYWQGSDPSTYPTSAAYDGVSSIFFASQSKSLPNLGSSVIGTTQVWYSTNTGEILDSDIILNDKYFYFTNTPTDSSEPATGSITSVGGKPRIFLGNTVTHEIGHALGLSHSGGLNSAMLFVEAPEQAQISCDDQIGIQSLYPGSQSSSRGSIHGTVAFNNTPLFGAHVLAISANRGTVLASALTDRSGQFQIGALEPGGYYLMVEPYYAGPQPLPRFYFGIDSRVCPNRMDYQRTFLTSRSDPNGYTLERINVSPESDADAGRISVQCDPLVMNPNPRSLDLQPSGNFAFIDILASQAPSRTYQIDHVGGTLRVSTLSYSLYSPIKVQLGITKLDGSSVNSRFDSPNYASSQFTRDSGFQNLDGVLTATNLDPGSYLLTVSTTLVPNQKYPFPSRALDADPFFLILGASQLPTTPSTDLANNARCRSSESFAAYRSPMSAPPSRFATPGQTKAGGACGRIRVTSDPGDTDSTPLAEMVGWFIPWLFTFVSLRGLILLHQPRRTIKLIS